MGHTMIQAEFRVQLEATRRSVVTALLELETLSVGEKLTPKGKALCRNLERLLPAIENVLA